MKNKYWLRLGNSADYEEYEDIESLAAEVAVVLPGLQPNLPTFRWGLAGVAIAPYFTGHNYISVYVGDDDAQIEHNLAGAEIAAFEQIVLDEWKEVTGK